jgi:hypothetical protein
VWQKEEFGASTQRKHASSDIYNETTARIELCHAQISPIIFKV